MKRLISYYSCFKPARSMEAVINNSSNIMSYNLKLRFAGVLLLLLMTAAVCPAQDRDSVKQPVPLVGWDSLRSLINYPEIGRRAAIWGAYEVRIQIDSTGRMIQSMIKLPNTDEVNYMTIADSVFVRTLNDIFNTLEWKPGTINDEPRTMWIAVPVIFNLNKKRGSGPALLIESTPAEICIIRTFRNNSEPDTGLRRIKRLDQ